MWSESACVSTSVSSAAHSECAQRRRDNALADIKGGTVGRILERRRRETAGVHEKCAAIREHQERRIALTNVEEHHTQSCGAGRRYGITRDGLRSGNNHDRDECRGRSCKPRHAQPQQSQGERQIVRNDDSPRGRRDFTPEPRHDIDKTCRIDQATPGQMHDITAPPRELAIPQPHSKAGHRPDLHDGHERDGDEVEEQTGGGDPPEHRSRYRSQRNLGGDGRAK